MQLNSYHIFHQLLQIISSVLLVIKLMNVRMQGGTSCGSQSPYGAQVMFKISVSSTIRPKLMEAFGTGCW